MWRLWARALPLRGLISRCGGSRGWRSYGSGWTAAGRLRQRPLLAEVVGVAHSRTLCVGGNRGIMRNSTVSSGGGLAPMCAGPPHCTWELDHHAQCLLEKPVIPTKNCHRPAEAPVSHVHHRRRPHPPGASGSVTTDPPQTRAGGGPISARGTTDLEPELDRSRRGVRPISANKLSAAG